MNHAMKGNLFFFIDFFTKNDIIIFINNNLRNR